MKDKKIDQNLILIYADCVTREIFFDPCIGSDGQTYEYDTLKNLIDNNEPSPITREILENIMIPNIRLKLWIDIFLQQNPQYQEFVYKPAPLYLREIQDAILHYKNVPEIIKKHEHDLKEITHEDLETLISTASQKKHIAAFLNLYETFIFKDSSLSLFKKYMKSRWGKYPNIIYCCCEEGSFDQLKMIIDLLKGEAQDLILSPYEDTKIEKSFINAFEYAVFINSLIKIKTLLQHLEPDKLGIIFNQCFFDHYTDIADYGVNRDKCSIKILKLFFKELPLDFKDYPQKIAIIKPIQEKLLENLKRHVNIHLNAAWIKEKTDNIIFILSLFSKEDQSNLIPTSILEQKKLLEFSYLNNLSDFFSNLLLLLSSEKIKDIFIHQQWSGIPPLLRILCSKRYDTLFFQPLISILGKSGLIESIQKFNGYTLNKGLIISNLLLTAIEIDKFDEFKIMVEALESEAKFYLLEKNHADHNALHLAIVKKQDKTLMFIIESMKSQNTSIIEMTMGAWNVFDLAIRYNNLFAFKILYEIMDEKDAINLILDTYTSITNPNFINSLSLNNNTLILHLKQLINENHIERIKKTCDIFKSRFLLNVQENDSLLKLAHDKQRVNCFLEIANCILHSGKYSLNIDLIKKYTSSPWGDQPNLIYYVCSLGANETLTPLFNLDNNTFRMYSMISHGEFSNAFQVAFIKNKVMAKKILNFFSKQQVETLLMQKIKQDTNIYTYCLRLARELRNTSCLHYAISLHEYHGENIPYHDFPARDENIVFFQVSLLNSKIETLTERTSLLNDITFFKKAILTPYQSKQSFANLIHCACYYNLSPLLTSFVKILGTDFTDTVKISWSNFHSGLHYLVNSPMVSEEILKTVFQSIDSATLKSFMLEVDSEGKNPLFKLISKINTLKLITCILGKTYIQQIASQPSKSGETLLMVATDHCNFEAMKYLCDIFDYKIETDNKTDHHKRFCEENNQDQFQKRYRR